jgi:signal transduction histidine kinase
MEISTSSIFPSIVLKIFPILGTFHALKLLLGQGIHRPVQHLDIYLDFEAVTVQLSSNCASAILRLVYNGVQRRRRQSHVTSATIFAAVDVYIGKPLI